MSNLRIPGPTPCPPEVLQAMSWQMINHRGPQFAGYLNEVTEGLKTIFQTRNDIFLLSSSGTGGLESAIVNTLSPGDKVLGVSIGVFGDRLASIAKTYGAEVIPLKFEWGKAADASAVAGALKANPGIKAVLVTHNETSTGVTNDLASIAKVVKSAGKLLLVDAVSSMGSINLPVDEWGVDVCVTGSQKGWMVPPGLAMVSVSPEAWKACEEAKMPRFYFDFLKAKKYAEKGQTPWTPCVSVVFGMTVAIKMMLEEGLPNIIKRHERIANMTRHNAIKLGLELFADEKYASNTVTSVHANKGLDGKLLNKIMREEYDVILGGGQQVLEGKIFRIGHLGWVDEKDIDAVFAALKEALPKAGFKGA
ncbi:MAG: alanine--glyoxylate aminotransferase family protein [Dehalococcoidales bacterium]|nr:alanine--glyoxylate aminotransferase family protein [Dehalococcoidales bacterium]MDX9986800.1 alanine--glyoxylate aminotransferase family protein [Dehalococcoidales bacterium]NLE90547.1 alanine--glyoxylate aminotransferase family protein [Dehalococcoidales bacterium]